MNNQKNDLLDLATTVQFEEKDLISKFEVEELEKRFEMGWGSGTLTTSVNYNQTTGVTGTISYSIKF